MTAMLGLGGRMGRLSFLIWSLLLGVAMAALTLAATFAMLPADLGTTREPPLRLILGVMLIVGPPFLWASLALHCKRVRDIGWRPLYVIPGWIAFNLLDVAAAVAVPSIARAEASGTAIGAIGNLLVVLALLFWPGAPDERFDSGHDGDAAVRVRPAGRLAATPVAPAPRAAAPSTPQGFGRRRTI